MSETLKKDLFAPIVIKKRRNITKRKVTHIPPNSWKKEYGSWAVKMGIFKTEQDQ